MQDEAVNTPVTTTLSRVLLGLLSRTSLPETTLSVRLPALVSLPAQHTSLSSTSYCVRGSLLCVRLGGSTQLSATAGAWLSGSRPGRRQRRSHGSDLTCRAVLTLLLLPPPALHPGSRGLWAHRLPHLLWTLQGGKALHFSITTLGSVFLRPARSVPTDTAFELSNLGCSSCCPVSLSLQLMSSK